MVLTKEEKQEVLDYLSEERKIKEELYKDWMSYVDRKLQKRELMESLRDGKHRERKIWVWEQREEQRNMSLAFAYGMCLLFVLSIPFIISLFN